jgi:hypothetical protein
MTEQNLGCRKLLRAQPHNFATSWERSNVMKPAVPKADVMQDGRFVGHLL